MAQFLTCFRITKSGKYENGVKYTGINQQRITKRKKGTRTYSPPPLAGEADSLEPGSRSQGGAGRGEPLPRAERGCDPQTPIPSLPHPRPIGEGGGVGYTVGTELGMKRVPKGQNTGLLSLFSEWQTHAPHPHTHTFAQEPVHRHEDQHRNSSIQRPPFPPLTPNMPTRLTAQRSGCNQGSSKA